MSGGARSGLRPVARAEECVEALIANLARRGIGDGHRVLRPERLAGGTGHRRFG